MNKKLSIVSFFMLLVILLLTILLFYGDIMSKYFNNNDNKQDESFVERMYMSGNLKGMIWNNGIDVNKDTYIKLQQHIKKTNSPILVCWFSSVSCKACYDFAEKKINEYFSDSISSKVFYIAVNFNKVKDFRKNNLLNLGEGRLGLPIEERLSVFFFVLKGRNVSDVFIPEKNFPQYTDVYLKNIIKKYFN